MRKKTSNYSPRLELLRIKLIHQFLVEGGGSFNQMMDFVNDRLAELGEKQILDRTLLEAISKFKMGDFEHHLSHLPKEQKAKLFKIKPSKNLYEYTPDSQKPQFGDLDDNERLSLPFLMGVLKQYEGLPAFEKIINILSDTFKLDNTEFQSSSIVVVKKPKLVNEEKIIELVVKILSYIKAQEIIEFAYYSVHKLKPLTEQNDYDTIMVAPMQIRLYENIYYLIGIDLKENKVRNFRLDQIVQLKVEDSIDENGVKIFFDYKKLEKKFKLKSFFDNVIGVWCHSETDRVHEIQIEFKEWAASYVKRLPIHETQKVDSENENNNTIVITIKIKLWPQKFSKQDAKERAPELAFLLGRFREFCTITKVTPI